MGWLVFFWILCAGTAAAIGATKGEGTLSFFLGLLFGPFGVMVAYGGNGKREPCPSCGELRYRAYPVCPHCQRELPAVPQ